MISKKGYSILEVLLAGSILALAIAGIVAAILVAQRNNQSSIAQSQALEMAKEGINALISIRDRDYTELVDVVDGALNFENGQWNIIVTPTATDDKLTNPVRTRRIKIETDTNNPDLKLVTVTVNYQINPEGAVYNLSLTETLSNIFRKNSTGGASAESNNYRLLDNTIGDINNTFE